MSEQLISTIDGKSLYAKSAASAGQAVNDGNGNNIADTYATNVRAYELGTALYAVQATLYPQTGKWNNTYETVTANSADWGKGKVDDQLMIGSKDQDGTLDVGRVRQTGPDTFDIAYGVSIDNSGITAHTNGPVGLAPETVINSKDIVVMKLPGVTGTALNISMTGLAANKQDKTGMTAYQTVEGMTGYQSAGEYVDNSAFTAATAGLNNGIAGLGKSLGQAIDNLGNTLESKKQDKSSMTAYQPVIEYGYDSDSKITAIDGTALAGGGGGDTSMCYPLTGGNLNGQLIASGAGSPSTAQTAPVYGKITATQRQNQAGLMTNGSVFAGDYKGTASQTIAVRRSAANSALAGRFQLYSDGAVSFQQISNDGTADSIVCQLQYGQTNTGFNWGTMASGSTVKHIAYTEDLTGQGKTYEGVAPIVVDNVENKISANTLQVTYQGLTHDDSLVHTSNDSVYALGVNSKAVFGSFQTVLWSGATANMVSRTLSEPYTNFEMIGLYGSGNSCGVAFNIIPTEALNQSNRTTVHSVSPWDGQYALVVGQRLQFINSTSLSAGSSFYFGMGNNTSSWAASNRTGQSIDMHLYKVVGINRTAGGN